MHITEVERILALRERWPTSGGDMTVVHCKRAFYTHYIGRPSVLGNPYTIGPDGDRDDVIEQFERYVRQDFELLDYIALLPEDAILGCWCAPKRCHGEVVVAVWKELHEHHGN